MRDMLRWTVPFILWNGLCLFLAGKLKRDAGVPTGYSRKIFHFLIFFSSCVIQWQWGLSRLCLFGVCTTAVLAWALIKGHGHLLYEALAREKDEPRRTLFIISPYLATLTGGLLSNFLFGRAAMAGYLVAGMGDAVGEIVGTQLGRHRYRVFSPSGVQSWRSVEGSLGVGLVSTLALLLVWHWGWSVEYSPHNILLAGAVGVACAVMEGISPHGWDNLTMQLLPAACTVWLLGN